ncbi:MAG: protein kinase [Rhodospirillaceae bacterium]
MKQADISRLGKYEILGELGKGAMGVVYKGKDPRIQREVAIKTVRTDMLAADDPEATRAQVARFEREAIAAGNLNHPNIVTIYDCDKDGDVAYIAMEFIKGRDLKEYFAADERFGIKDIVRIMSDVLAGLDHAHKKHIVHRDIKPANIMLTEAGEVKITDFGIARLESSNLTQAGAVMGTPAYMSPEQFMGQQVDTRSDIFSAGGVLYQLLANEKPFTGTLTTIMHRVLNSQPEPPSVLNVQVPRAFDQVVAKAMAKRPEERYQSAAEFAAALRDAADGKLTVPDPVSFAGDAEGTMMDNSALATMAGGKQPAEELMPARGLADEGRPRRSDGALTAPPRPESRPESRPEPEPAGSNKGVMIGAAVAGLLVAGGIGGWLVLGGKPAPAPAPVMVERPALPPVPDEAAEAAKLRARLEAEQARLERVTAAAEAEQARRQAEEEQVRREQAARLFIEEQARREQAAVAAAEAKRLADEQAANKRQVAMSGAALGPVRTAVARAPCALLKVEPASAGDTLMVTGVAGEGEEGRLRTLIDQAAAGMPYSFKADPLARTLCESVGAVQRLRERNQELPQPVSLLPINPGAIYKNGQDLVFEVRAPGFPAYMQVDYFTLEGDVVHLLPNRMDTNNRLPADGLRKLGEKASGGQFWTIGAPFGRELIVAIASAKPLFANSRAAAEKAPAYLAELRKALDAAGKAGGQAPVAATMVITTVPN